MKRINVLNHGFVRLIDSMGSDLAIVRSARVSYDAEWRAGDDAGKDAKLIDYLVRNQHTSPLECVQFTFEVKAPIFVLRQWHRHRTWCLAGDTKIEFRRPVDGRPYKVRIDRLAASWNPKEAKRRRKDQSSLSLQEHNRLCISGMALICRGPSGELSTTRVTDVWQSGEKQVFEVSAGCKKVRASSDHKFFSAGRWVSVGDLRVGDKITLLGIRGSKVAQMQPEFTEEDLAPALDNRIDDLAWGTSSDNQGDSKRNGTKARQAWVEETIISIKPAGIEPVYDMTVEDGEHNFVANNFLVHNCFNEVSARYSELPEEFYIPEVSQITTQSTSNKQMRTDTEHPDAARIQDDISIACQSSFRTYHDLLKKGVPRELARGVLPVNTYSHMFASVDLHNLAHFLKLRLHEHSQYEIRVYAEAMLELIEPIVPVAVAALKKHGGWQVASGAQ